MRYFLFIASLGTLLVGMVTSSCEQLCAEDPRSEPRSATVERINALFEQAWAQDGIQAAAACSDDEFLRRVYLDLTGVIPHVSTVRSFLNDSAPDKRERLVDELLGSPEYATHMANTWRRIMVPGGFSAEQLPNVLGVQNWLRQKFAANLRYDRLVADLLVAQGGGEAGPALFYTAHQLEPEKLAAATSRIFLGIQLECAQCHDHPSDRWSQQDFWGFAAFFAQLESGNSRPGMMSASILDRDEGEVTIPESDTIVAPRYLGSTGDVGQQRGTRRMMLAVWLASRDNPYLGRAAVNRVWSLLFGRGLVEPVDDMSPHNVASQPEVLEALTDYFVTSGYDVQELLRVLTRTNIYQLSSVAMPGATLPEDAFAAMPVKPLTSEQMFDSMLRALLDASQPTQMFFPGLSLDQRRLEFVLKMQSLQSNSIADYELGIPQALGLMNSPQTRDFVDPDSSRLIKSLQAPFLSDDDRLAVLYLATVSRPPSYDEQQEFQPLLKSAQDPTQRQRLLSDVLWGLLNSAEFAVNR